MRERDHKAILQWTMEWPRAETGGDLWGEWIEPQGCVIKAVTGPGARARHYSTAFFQDPEYLRVAGAYLAPKSAYHIGTWHSHHTIDLPEPSAGDERTYSLAMIEHDREQFIAFVAAIEHGRPVVRPFFYRRGILHGVAGTFAFEDGPDHSAALRDLAGPRPCDPARPSDTPRPSDPPTWINDPDIVPVLRDLQDTIDAKFDSSARPAFKDQNFVIRFTIGRRHAASLTLKPEFKAWPRAEFACDDLFQTPHHLKATSLQTVASEFRKKIQNHLRAAHAA